VKLGWPIEPRFFVPEDTLAIYREAGNRGHNLAENWDSLLKSYLQHFPEEGKDLDRRLKGTLPENWESVLPKFEADQKGMATRVASGQALNAAADILPELVGGSADLTPSNKTKLKNSPDYTPDERIGRYFHFGVREHAMGAIVNGLAYHGGFIPFGATFLVFTDYMRGAIRISALSHLHSIWVMTHDSVGLGEDGPTHQPIEHLASLRAIPGLTVIRPCDANETVQAWKFAIKHKAGPTLLALTRQAVPTLDRISLGSAEGLNLGAYVLAELGDKEIQLILMASGSEVSLVLEAAKRIAASGFGVRVVSFPSWELFEKAEKTYQESVLPAKIKKRIAVELGVSQGWEKWVGDKGIIVGIDKYGASAPYQKIFEEYGFTVDKIVEKAMALLRMEI
jgi:transketolase